LFVELRTWGSVDPCVVITKYFMCGAIVGFIKLKPRSSQSFHLIKSNASKQSDSITNFHDIQQSARFSPSSIASSSAPVALLLLRS
jgi:hypothetical protein